MNFDCYYAEYPLLFAAVKNHGGCIGTNDQILAEHAPVAGERFHRIRLQIVNELFLKY
jgi:hypothetical protein